MSESSEVPQTEVAVEAPAKVTDTVQVDAAPEVAGEPAVDEVTANLEAQPAE